MKSRAVLLAEQGRFWWMAVPGPSDHAPDNVSCGWGEEAKNHMVAPISQTTHLTLFRVDDCHLTMPGVVGVGQGIFDEAFRFELKGLSPDEAELTQISIRVRAMTDHPLSRWFSSVGCSLFVVPTTRFLSVGWCPDLEKQHLSRLLCLPCASGARREPADAAGGAGGAVQRRHGLRLRQGQPRSLQDVACPLWRGRWPRRGMPGDEGDPTLVTL
jgi:hypothetical protein